MEDDEVLSIKDNDFLRQFEATIDGDFVKLEYSLQTRKIFLTKFVMSEALKKQGYQEKFMTAVFDQLLEQNIRVVPTSPDVTKFFKAHKRKYKKIMPLGISI